MRRRPEKYLTFRFAVPRQQQRFREIIVYVAEKCRDAEFFGATKLNKILYHADFRAFQRFGVPITGSMYFRLRYGPAPVALVPVRRQLENEGSIYVEKRPIGNKQQDRVVPLRSAHLDLFTKDEIHLVDEVIQELWHETAEQVTRASHDIRWRTRNDRDLIPYEAAYLLNDPISDEEIETTKSLADKFGWDEA